MPCEVLTSTCPGDRGTEVGAAPSEQSNKRSYPDLASEAERQFPKKQARLL